MYQLPELSDLLEHRDALQALGQRSSGRPDLLPFQLIQYVSLYGANDVSTESARDMDVPMFAKRC